MSDLWGREGETLGPDDDPARDKCFNCDHARECHFSSGRCSVSEGAMECSCPGWQAGYIKDDGSDASGIAPGQKGPLRNEEKSL